MISEKPTKTCPSPLVVDQLVEDRVVPLLISDGFCRLVGMERKTAAQWFMGGQFERIHPDDVGIVTRVSEEFAHHRGDYNVIFRCRHADGYHYVHAVGEWMTAPDGTELAVLTYTDVSESGKTIVELSHQYGLFQRDLFYTDPVTGLPNTNYLHKYANARVHSLRVQGVTPVLAYIDVNSMQFYNNQYGIEKGDDLLRLIAAALTEALPDALAVRGAEDHFILIDGSAGREGMIRGIEEANRRIREQAFGNTTGIHAGLCRMEGDMLTAKAMDHARHAIRLIETDLNTVCCVFSPEYDDLYWNQRYIVENFEKALENGWFKVYYQGIADVTNGKGVTLEALGRSRARHHLAQGVHPHPFQVSPAVPDGPVHL